MAHLFYKLAEDGLTPVPCDDPNEYMRWFLECGHERRIDETNIGEASVSTTFVGANLYPSAEEPLLYETLVFGGPLDGSTTKSSTREQAEEAHQAMCERVRGNKQHGTAD